MICGDTSALLLLNHLKIFACRLLISNDMIFCSCNLEETSNCNFFQRLQIALAQFCASLKIITRAYLFQTPLEIMRLPIQKTGVFFKSRLKTWVTWCLVNTESKEKEETDFLLIVALKLLSIVICTSMFDSCLHTAPACFQQDLQHNRMVHTEKQYTK